MYSLVGTRRRLNMKNCRRKFSVSNLPNMNNRCGNKEAIRGKICVANHIIYSYQSLVRNPFMPELYIWCILWGFFRIQSPAFQNYSYYSSLHKFHLHIYIYKRIKTLHICYIWFCGKWLLMQRVSLGHKLKYKNYIHKIKKWQLNSKNLDPSSANGN